MKLFKNIFIFPIIALTLSSNLSASETTLSLPRRIADFFASKVSYEVDGQELNKGFFKRNVLGALRLGETLEKTITVTNITEKTIVLAPLTISANSSFQIKTNIAANTRLEPNQKASVVVVAHPTAGYTHRATLSLASTSKFSGIRMLNTNAVSLAVDIVPSPKLAVYDGAQLVASGGAVALGSVQLGGAVQKTLTYKNDGEGNLDIKSAFIFSKDFKFIEIPNGTLASGESKDLVVEFTPTQSGQISVPMLIGSIDPTNAQYRINFTANVVGASSASALRVYAVDQLVDGVLSDEAFIPHNQIRNENFVYLGGTTAGSASFLKVFRLYNSGQTPLRINDVANVFPNGNLSLRALSPSGASRKLKSGRVSRVGRQGIEPAVTPGFPLTILPGSYVDLNVQLSPSTNMVHTGYVEFRTDDANVPNYQFNIAAAVGGPTGLLCAGDNNNWVAEGFSCAGKANGTICGSNSEEKTKVCNQNQCVLMGDLNSDGFVDSSDIEDFAKMTSGLMEPALSLDTRCSGNITTVTTEQIQDFASLLVDGSNKRTFNTRVVENCSHRDLSNDPTRGRALVFANGAIDFDTMKATTPDGVITKDTPILYKPQVEVCLDNLGMYDLAGNYSPNNGITFGKYASASMAPLNQTSENLPRFGAYVNLQNDFRFSAFGDDGLNDPRKAILRSGAVQLYHDVNYFRSAIVNDGFVKALKLDPAIEANLMVHQSRSDLIMKNPGTLARPFSMAVEQKDEGGINLQPENGFMRVASRVRAKAVTYDTLGTPPASTEGFDRSIAPLSNAFDRTFASADFAGMMFFWITQNNDWHTYTEAFFGENELWRTNIAPAVNDGLSAWEAYRILGTTEIYKDAEYMARMWSEFGACHEGFIPCDKGQEIRNVMMNDLSSLHPKTVFPFTPPLGGLIFNGERRYDGPLVSDLSGLFIAAVFYDISTEAGLGDRNADLLIWKAISLLTNPGELSMNQFGLKILEAARLLFSDPTDSSKSIFDSEIRSVLYSRGITLNDSASVASMLPLSVKGTENIEFSSPNPNYQPDPNDYGQSVVTTGVFTASGTGDQTMLQFMKHSKLGPCDSLSITDGTFTENGTYQDNGSYLNEFKDRELNNLFVLVPGKKISWRNIAKRCDTEFEGFYAEDLTSLGFRVVSANVAGFGIEAAVLKNGQYLLSVVNDMGGSFEWTVSQPGEPSRTLSGVKVKVTLNPKLPVILKLKKSDGTEISISDSLNLLKERKVLTL